MIERIVIDKRILQPAGIYQLLFTEEVPGLLLTGARANPDKITYAKQLLPLEQIRNCH